MSIIAYFTFLFCTGIYAKRRRRLTPKLIMRLTGVTVAFAVLMMVFMENMRVNIFVTVAYVWSIVGVLIRSKRQFDRLEE